MDRPDALPVQRLNGAFSIGSLPSAGFVGGWRLRTDCRGGQKACDRGLWRSVISGSMDMREGTRARDDHQPRTVSRAMTLLSDSSEAFWARTARFDRGIWIVVGWACGGTARSRVERATGLNPGVLVWSLYELAGLASLARSQPDWLDVSNGGVMHINSSGSQPNGVSPEHRASPIEHRYPRNPPQVPPRGVHVSGRPLAFRRLWCSAHITHDVAPEAVMDRMVTRIVDLSVSTKRSGS